MDKKTILAFVLSLVVLIAWSVLFAPKPTEKKEPQGKEEPSKSQPAQPAPTVQKMEKPAEPAVVVADEKEVTVDTPLYRAVFSTKGAAIKSFKLKKYRVTAEPDSPLVELVHGPAPLVAIQLDTGGKSEPAPVIYQVTEN
ncbi:MAG: membrane protein insertase YidC, partial [Desulfobacterota bacterium]|nr:membrane protein insertase YidC [Thermodesulfobacteriota bacterium]